MHHWRIAQPWAVSNPIGQSATPAQGISHVAAPVVRGSVSTHLLMGVQGSGKECNGAALRTLREDDGIIPEPHCPRLPWPAT